MKRTLIITSLLIISLLLYLILKTNTVTFYIGVANPSLGIDLRVEFERDVIYNDSLSYNPFKYNIIQKEMKSGFYKMLISSNICKIEQQESLFVLFDQHIVVEYYPENVNEDKFIVRNNLRKFYIE